MKKSNPKTRIKILYLIFIFIILIGFLIINIIFTQKIRVYMMILFLG